MIDQYIFQQINQLAGKWPLLDGAAVFFAEYLGYILLAAVFLFLLRNYKQYWPMAVKGLLGAILARFIITELIRFFWFKPRPFVSDKVNLLFSHPATSSFPSGHAAFYFALAVVVYSYNKKAGLLFFGASFLISISRVFAGVHWPSDILVGAFVGILSGWLVLKIIKRV